ncbi:hypothetical protein SARC_15981 [Sphaeroforma arctica JP610]|uniref:Uncharacterized protein n=1 Tax=Sphaeroforma arctica JP610 TaxID=667725 RepID=A0A0L0F431_9EUKA|nr:hypothetical protein SARC_15981 [Sphaeroforma arctica JP610]KNC71480.1 hypothetical protein SARC_15981 [Sphaeroforma arctica JP610]|eukprot:XP_014145382.1 hypothetical protein SARC_15981 [Sphaeroforma arctica JP610]
MNYMTKKYPASSNSQSNLVYTSSGSRRDSSWTISYRNSAGSTGLDRGSYHHHTHPNHFAPGVAGPEESIPDLETYTNLNNTHPIVDSTEEDTADIPDLSTFEDSDSAQASSETSASGIDSYEDVAAPVHTFRPGGADVGQGVESGMQGQGEPSETPLDRTLPNMGEKSAAHAEVSFAERIKSRGMREPNEEDREKDGKTDADERLDGLHTSLEVGSGGSDSENDDSGHVYLV